MTDLKCDHCGNKIPYGTGGIQVVDEVEHNLCHPDDPDALDCYWLVTVGPEPVGYRKTNPDAPIIRRSTGDFYKKIMENL